MTTVINYFGGPGVGKSTKAAERFARMKRNGIEVELITEFAKELVWEKRYQTIKNQILLLGEQKRRIDILIGQVEYIITDSPLPLSIIYKPADYSEVFDLFCMEIFNQYKNVNYYIPRKYDYISNGRNESIEQAEKIDSKILDLFNKYCVIYEHY